MQVAPSPGANGLLTKFVNQADASKVGSAYIATTYGPSEAFGIFSCLPVFASGASSGVMLSTGDVTQFNQALPQTDFGLVGVAGDSIGLQIAFTTTTASTLKFQYVFASSELPVYMGSTYNDLFEMRLINTQTKETHNIAYLPDTCFNSATKTCNNPEANGKCHVTINNLGMQKDASIAGSKWSPCYVDNPTGQYFLGYKGYTKELTATYTLTASSPYTLNITITDVSDGKYDSVVFLEANTFSVVPTTRRSILDGEAPAAQQVKETVVAAPSMSASGQHSTGVLATAVVGAVVGTAAVALLIALALRRRNGSPATELRENSQELHKVTAHHVRPSTTAVPRSCTVPRCKTSRHVCRGAQVAYPSSINSRRFDWDRAP